MRTSRIMACVSLISLVVSPVFAEPRDPSTISKKEADAMVKQTVDSVPMTADGSFDISKVRMTKKEYIDQLSSSFDMMDKNGDGVVDGSEMSGMQSGSAGADYSEGNVVPVRSQPSRAVAPAGGVPALNAKDLLNK